MITRLMTLPSAEPLCSTVDDIVPAMPERAPSRHWHFAAALVCLLLLGAALRIYPSTGFKGIGFDEGLYGWYIDQVKEVGVTSYPDVVENYIAVQSRQSGVILPPTRFLYIFCSSVWSEVFGTTSIGSAHAVSCVFSILMLGLVATWSLRLGGRSVCLGVLGLLCCAPVEIHLSQHGMIDGFFAFWAVLALWALWECLQAPGNFVWQAVYGAALALMVLTKENAFFVYVALMGLIILNLKFRFGAVTRQLLLVSFCGPLLGLVILLFLCGGVANLVDAYRLLVTKASTMQYAIKTGDGPWHRYLVDLLLTNPIVLLLAVGTICRTNWNEKKSLYLIGFMALSYTLMCNVRYSMNLRYATIWDLPLHYFAYLQLRTWSESFGRFGSLLLAGSISLICAYNLHQYWVFFVHSQLHELVSQGLLEALKILK